MKVQTNYWGALGRRPLSRRRLLKGTAVSGVGLAGIGLVGCGDDDDADPAATATSSGGTGGTPSASPSQGVSQPKSGGSFRDRSIAGISFYEPYASLSYSAQQHWGYMTNRVLRYAYGPEYSPTDSTLEPDIASAMPEQPDPLTVIIPIREGVKFHDVAPANGRAMTAEDVAWSLRRYQAIGQRKADYAAIDSIEATDDKTVTLKLNTQTASVLSNLGDDKLMWVLAKEAAGEAEMSNTSPFVGTGPFIWESYDPDVVIKFRRNPDYWEGDGKPHFDAAEIAIIGPEATADASFRAGQLSLVDAIQDNDRFDQLSTVEGVQSVTYADTAGRVKEFSNSEPFTNPQVRQALSMAVDRDEMAAALGCIDYGWSSNTHGTGYTPWVLSPKSPDFGENAKYFEYNPDEAKAMLSAAGFDDDSPLEFTHIYTNEYAGEQLQAELLVDQFSRIGVKLTLEQYPYTEWQQKYKVSTGAGWRNWQGLMGNAPAVFADPTAAYKTYWLYGDSTRGMAAWQDPELVRMVDEQDQELDHEARVEKLHEVQRYYAGVMYNIPVYTPFEATMWHPNLKNVHPRTGNARGVEMVARIWFDEA